MIFKVFHMSSTSLPQLLHTQKSPNGGLYRAFVEEIAIFIRKKYSDKNTGKSLGNVVYMCFVYTGLSRRGRPYADGLIFCKNTAPVASHQMLPQAATQAAVPSARSARWGRWQPEGLTEGVDRLGAEAVKK